MKFIGWYHNYLPKGEGISTFYFLFIPLFSKKFNHSTSWWE